VSANSWLRAWIGLEINLLAFIPLIRDNNNLISTEASLKYFLTQALASSVLLFAVVIIFLNNYPSIQINTLYTKIIILSSLLIKRGAAPFHFWFPNVMEGLSWINRLILITWQKIAPLILISSTMQSRVIIVTIFLSVIIGALGGLNQTSLRKLIAYSSINHLGWIFTAIEARESLWVAYFIFYSFLSFSIIFIFNTFKISHINQLFSLFFNSKTIKFIVFLNLLSLGGLPPFLGFIPKWLVIQSLIANRQLITITVLTVTSLITLFFYLRLCFAAFILNYYETNWITSINIPKTIFKNLIILSFISSFGLFLISLIYMFL